MELWQKSLMLCKEFILYFGFKRFLPFFTAYFINMFFIIIIYWAIIFYDWKYFQNIYSTERFVDINLKWMFKMKEINK